jgi:hypothetical protein
LEAEPVTGNNRNQGKCLGTKLGALQFSPALIPPLSVTVKSPELRDLIMEEFNAREQEIFQDAFFDSRAHTIAREVRKAHGRQGWGIDWYYI